MRLRTIYLRTKYYEQDQRRYDQMADWAYWLIEKNGALTCRMMPPSLSEAVAGIAGRIQMIYAGEHPEVDAAMRDHRERTQGYRRGLN